MQVVYNGALPPPLQHRPVLSFNERGEYIGDTEELLSDCCKEDISPSEAHDQSNVTSAVLLQKEGTTAASTALGIAKPQVQTFPKPFTQVSFSVPTCVFLRNKRVLLFAGRCCSYHILTFFVLYNRTTRRKTRLSS